MGGINGKTKVTIGENPQEWEKEIEELTNEACAIFTGRILCARNAELREKVKELGHQQDDDTIWCTLDEVLTLLKD